MTTFMTFRPFFNAMIAEMRRHDPKKKDTWKDDEIWMETQGLCGFGVPSTGQYVKTDKALDKMLDKVYKKYQEKLANGDVEGAMGELLDIGNTCAMRWMRHNSDVKTRS